MTMRRSSFSDALSCENDLPARRAAITSCAGTYGSGIEARSFDRSMTSCGLSDI